AGGGGGGGFGGGAGVVGNLVRRQARARADRLGRVVERAGGVVAGDDELPGRMQRGKWRVLLDSELVERKMLAGLEHGAVELGGPDLRRLARARIDQIERIALEDRARDRDRVERLTRRVQPAKLFQ